MTQVTATRQSRATASAAASASRPSGGVALPSLISAVWKATVLVVLAVAVIIGILAMHSFTSPASHSDMGMPADSSTASVAPHHAEEGVFAAASPDCLGCGEETSMALMWCVFALLAVTLLMTAPKLVKGWVGVASRQFSITTSELRSVGLIPRPPSLTVLCISRT
jgi:hypothetical protein